jgi:hypothetical protein
MTYLRRNFRRTALILPSAKDLAIVNGPSHSYGLPPKVTGCRCRWIFVLQVTALLLPVSPLGAQDQSPIRNSAQGTSNSQQGSAPSEEELAKEVKNPFADLIQIQVGNNFGFGGDAGNGLQYEMTLQPVIPIKITDDWNLITRSSFSVISVPEPDSGMARTTGASDLFTEFYFSPDKQTPFIWGFGPVLGIPTASDASLGTGKWTLGPGFAIIKQTEHWQYGVLVNHAWSFAGDKNRGNVSSTFLQPLLYYTWGNGWTLGLDAESTYDWTALRGNRWTVPVQASISKVTNFLRQPVSLSLGIIPYAVAPAGSPSVAINFTMALLFPRKGR